MVSSAKLALPVLFQNIRSSNLGRKLKGFILRCLLFWPRILRSLRKVWSWYTQTRSSDEKNTKDTGGSSSTRELRKHEGCVVVCASRAFGRVPVGEPSGHVMPGSSDAEQSIPMEDIFRQNPSAPRTLSSNAPSHSAPPSPPDSPHTSSSSLREESAHGRMEWFMHRSSTPVNWTHSRASRRQSTGVSPRSRSRSPSPSTFQFLRRHSSRQNTPTRSEIDIPTRLAMIQHSLDSPDRDGSSSFGISIEIKGPSRPRTPEDTRSVYSLSSVHDPTQRFSTHHQLPSTELVDPPAESEGHSSSGYGTIIAAHQSTDSIQYVLRVP